MKQTRKIFVLNGFSFAGEEILLKELNFKALTVFYKKDISLEELVTVFKHNKCALCISCNLPGNFLHYPLKTAYQLVKTNSEFHYQQMDTMH